MTSVYGPIEVDSSSDSDDQNRALSGLLVNGRETRQGRICRQVAGLIVLVTCIAATLQVILQRPGGEETSASALRGQARGADVEKLNDYVGVDDPQDLGFEAHQQRYIEPYATEVAGPKATNKFWANWVVRDGAHLPIFPMPYSLKWSDAGLEVSHGDAPTPQYDVSHSPFMYSYTTALWGELVLGAREGIVSHGEAPYRVVKEDIFGIHVELRDKENGRLTFPIYSGMAYVSGKYEGGLTPRIGAGAGRALSSVQKVRDGVWRFSNNGGRVFRVYVLDVAGNFVDGTYSFDDRGEMSRPLHGWVRVAHEQKGDDAVILDEHAPAVLAGMNLVLHDKGKFEYVFENVGRKEAVVLHWSWVTHRKLIRVGAKPQQTLTPILAPTKGYMTAMLGNTWILQSDVDDVGELDFLPAGNPKDGKEKYLMDDTVDTFEALRTSWRSELFRAGFYSSGKGFQKVGYMCLLLERFFGRTNEKTQHCADMLEAGFRCLSDPRSTGDCANAPPKPIYDRVWGGIVNPSGYNDGQKCAPDYGNACYNDHHYHWGYFVVSGAILAKLKPSCLEDASFTNTVNILIRDAANPSDRDPYFPQFRSFDFFDLHSWSKGIQPSASGKDEESTSEEVNFYFGIYLWGKVNKNARLRELGQLLVALDIVTFQSFFALKNDNSNHPDPYQRNHVAGVFFQNQVTYGTWFSAEKYCIHGIQMMPLTPALQLSRKLDFVREEWDDILGRIPRDKINPPTWTSVILTGGLAMIDPDRAYNELCGLHSFDDGLTRTWALFWAAVQPGATGASDAAGSQNGCIGRKVDGRGSHGAPADSSGEGSSGRTANNSAGPPPGSAAACSSHPGCQGLTGDCCPTSAGMQLGCCSLTASSCAAHAGCNGLSGDCCPTTQGVLLGCCS